MGIGNTIIKLLKEQRRTQTWLANQVGIKRVTFALKVKKDRFTAEELVLMAIELNVDLNVFKACYQAE